jgi:uncharacterized protein with PIN domain
MGLVKIRKTGKLCPICHTELEYVENIMIMDASNYKCVVCSKFYHEGWRGNKGLQSGLA